MTTLASFLERLGAAGLTSVWLPLALWTLCALPLYFALRRWDRAHPLVPYHAGQALLFALPLGLLLASAFDFAWLLPPSRTSAQAAPFVIVLPELAPQTSSTDVRWNGYHALGALTALAAALALWRLGRLAWQAVALQRLRRTFAPAGPDVQARLDRLARQHEVGRPVTALVADVPLVPMTFGWRRPAIVVPLPLTSDPEALELAFAHELAHVRRRDFLLQWAEQVVGAVFFAHPLVFALRRSVVGWRERCCDAEVVARPGVSRKRYAALLLGLADAPASPNRFALSMADVPSNLKTRILAMNRLSTPRLNPKWAGLGLGAVLLGAATLVVACSDVIGANEADVRPTPPSASKASPEGDVFMIVEDMPEMLPSHQEGMFQLGQCLRYPEIAKKAGIEGRVFVQFVIDTEGNVTEAEVARGLGAGTDQEALRCVEELKFTPGKQNGEVVPVKMSLPVTFRLRGGEAPEQRTASTTPEEDRQRAERLMDEMVIVNKQAASGDIDFFTHADEVDGEFLPIASVYHHKPVTEAERRLAAERMAREQGADAVIFGTADEAPRVPVVAHIPYEAQLAGQLRPGSFVLIRRN